MSETVQQEWLSVEEMQELLGIGRTKAYELISRRELPAVRIGRAVRVRKSDVEHYVRSNKY